MPTLQGTSIRTGFSSTVNPATGTIGSYTPKAGDIIAVFIRTGISGIILNNIAGWVNSPAGVVSSDVHSEAAVYHVVTAAEQIAGTAAWTLTGIFQSAQTGATYTTALRGVDLKNPIDSFGTAVVSSAVTPHVLAGLTGLRNNSLVLSGIGGDSTQTYSTTPAGWTIRASNVGGQNTGAVLSLNALTTYGVDLAATNFTPSSACRYASITLAFNDVKKLPSNYNRSILDRVAR